MRNDKRKFQIFDLEIKTKKNNAELPTIENILPIFQKTKENKTVHSLSNGKIGMLIADIKIIPEKNLIILLIRLSNQSTPDHVISNLKEGTYRKDCKQDGEGSDFCCHVIISTKQEQNLPNRYLCFVEYINSIGFNKVKSLLSKFLHYEYQKNEEFFSYPCLSGAKHKDGTPKMERCLPFIELKGRPSEELIDDLEHGTIKHISLVQTETINSLDSYPYLNDVEKKLKISTDKEKYPEILWNSLKDLFKSKSSQYNQAKIKYKKPDSNTSYTINIDTKTGNILSEYYIEYFELTGISPLLEQSSQEIVKHLIDRALPIFLKKRNI